MVLFILVNEAVVTMFDQTGRCDPQSPVRMACRIFDEPRYVSKSANMESQLPILVSAHELGGVILLLYSVSKGGVRLGAIDSQSIRLRLLGLPNEPHQIISLSTPLR